MIFIVSDNTHGVTKVALNYRGIYAHRFQGISPEKKRAAWAGIARHIQSFMPKAEIILDPAAGQCEFINQVQARERWAVDQEAAFLKNALPGVRVVPESIFTAALPEGYFDGVFISNILEHLDSPEMAAAFLRKMNSVLKPGGRLVVMGPNFKYCAEEYFDCIDHRLILTDRSTEELLVSEGFRIAVSFPRYLPYSFRGRLPVSAALIRMYLRFPVVWPLLGKQYLIVAEKP